EWPGQSLLVPAPEGPRGARSRLGAEVPGDAGPHQSWGPRCGSHAGKAESALPSPLETRRRGLGPAPEVQAGRGSLGAAQSCPPSSCWQSGEAGAGPGPSFTNTWSPQEFKGGKQEAIGWGPGLPRGGEQRGPQHPAAEDPEKPPSSDKEVFPPGNDLRDPRSAPGGPQPRSTICRLDGFLLNAWGALGLPRPRRAGMLAEGLRKIPGPERLAGEEEKRDGTGKPPGGNQGLHTR
ncbi:unnamed protein product, partial [Rangifer tarandus platyrhynchus]